MTITTNDTALVSIYQIFPLKDDAGVTTWIWDCLFQEIDIATNALVFEWRASEHYSVEDTYRNRGGEGSSPRRPFDWFHLNSVQKDEYGNYLISARYTHSITYIHGTTGQVIWVLGGKRNTFEDLSKGKALNFGSQHYARVHPLSDFPNLLKNNGYPHGIVQKDGVTTQLLSMFDNSRDDRYLTNKVSRGLLLEISYPSGDFLSHRDEFTVREIKSYYQPTDVTSESQGSFQVVPSLMEGQDPKILLGYGRYALWAEFSAEGKLICNNLITARRAADVQSYRVLKYPWIGRPLSPPKAVLHNESLYVSWNGATEVYEWALQHAQQSASVSTDGSDGETSLEWDDYIVARKDSFETEFELYAGVKQYLRVAAIDVTGKVIGYSDTLNLGSADVSPTCSH